MDISTEFLGVHLPSPVAITAMGNMFKLHPEGDLEMTRGAGRDGSLLAVPYLAGWPLEEIAPWVRSDRPIDFPDLLRARRSIRGFQRDQVARIQACPGIQGRMASQSMWPISGTS